MALSLSILAIVVFSLIFQPKSSSALFEDQVGLLDWRKTFIGKTKFVHFDVSSHTSKRLYVATESNVLASLNSRTGQVMWRIVMEENEGQIDALLHKGSFLVSVSGGGKFVRSWDTSSGSLLWENMMYKGAPDPDAPKRNFVYNWNGIDAVITEHKGIKQIVVVSGNLVKAFSLQDGSEYWSYHRSNDTIKLYAMSHSGSKVHVIGVQDEGRIIVQSLSAGKGQLDKTKSLAAPWVSSGTASCIISQGKALICADSLTHSLHIGSLENNSQEMAEVILSTLTGADITSLKPTLQAFGSYTNSWMSQSEFVLHLSPENHLLLKLNPDLSIQIMREYTDNCLLFGSVLNDKAIVVSMMINGDSLDLQSLDLESGKEISEMAQKVKFLEHHGQPELATVYLFAKKEQSIGYRVFLLTSDHTMSLIQQTGRIMWSREEALAEVTAVDVVELPFSPAQANFNTLQEEFGAHPNDDVLSMFIRRIRAQAKQFQALVKQFQTFVNAQQGHAPAPDVTTAEDEQLTRDQFNLRKLILIATASGKMFGLDSSDGSVLWETFLPGLKPFSHNNKEFHLLYTQRTVAHFPLPAQCVIIGKSGSTNNSVLHVFNPISGKPLDEDNPQGNILPFKVMQTMLMPHLDNKHAKILLLLDSEKNVHVFPDTKDARSTITKEENSIFFYLVDRETGSVTGHMLRKAESGKLGTQEMWRVQIPTSQQKITVVASKNPLEHVHSQGKVLGDRRVLYKYLNPNLIAIATEAVTDGKPSTSVYLIDAVTGMIIYTNRHKNAKGPVHLVHSENWAVYSMYNTKSRRYELVVLELYEGYEERNSTAFSSMDPPPHPMILHQSYVFPTTIRTMTVSITERGITNKHLLLGLQTGYILSIPKNFLDPRRTFNPTQEDREEGLYPYIPEMTIMPQAYINYNQTIMYIKGIHTAPSGLESTCLVFGYGLDLYWAQITPSRMFDVLKEDFDYWFIAGTLLVLILVTVISNRLASIKMLRQAWQ
ncbi:predicted protein [Nematostella vectensis]|uniref:ER membrane protein complex subunit 1 n=2 Tax=Nematostella vectensis TaxID=45351 RepID=A7RNR6_NEMVE|nr:predicted protein [Nematostella vectensis]|eukprot:XP_001638961.1 predicted protein [Nematostella vectensis]